VNSTSLFFWWPTPQGNLAAKKPDRIAQIDQFMKLG
jgi:hypothetical protein